MERKRLHKRAAVKNEAKMSKFAEETSRSEKLCKHEFRKNLLCKTLKKCRINPLGTKKRLPNTKENFAV